MARLTQKAKKHRTRLRALAREQRLLNLKRRGERLISDRVLKLLAAAELPPQREAYQQKLHELLGEVAMRRERKREEKERRFLTRQERLRERRQRKNSSPVEACQPAGDEHAGGRNVSAEGMEGSPGEIAAAGFFPDRGRGLDLASGK